MINKLKRTFLIVLSVLTVLCAMPVSIPSFAAASLSLGKYVTKGCVFRQNAPITVPGTAEAGAKIIGTIADDKQKVVSSAETTADEKGNFVLTFPAIKGGYTKHTLKVSDGTNEKIVTSVLFGEVWLTGGQSNMEYWLNWTPAGNKLKASDMKDSDLRVYKANAGTPGWILGNNLEKMGTVTGVGYYFAKELREKLDVPVAIIDTAVGSSNIYQWITKAALLEDPELNTYVNTLGTAIGDHYQKNVAPIEGITVSGMIWYQGESNSGNKPGYYRRAIELLRSSWGKKFGFTDSKMPMIFAHIAPHRYLEHDFDVVPRFADELNAAWAAQPDVTAQITTYDLSIEYKTVTGSIAPIHPTNKDQVGKRFADAALGLVYGKEKEYTSPAVKSTEIRDGAIYVTFDHVGDGLTSGGSELKGFSICGEDKIYVGAKAKIVSSDTVMIWSPYVPAPKSAAYAWSQLNNLSNLSSTKDGKPLFGAVPFRTSEEALAHYYRPHDFTYCDEDKIWESVASEANWNKAWSATGATVSIDKENAFSGDASLHVKVKDAGTVSVKPHIPATVSVDHDYTNYGGIAMVVKNLGDEKITLTKVTFTNASGKTVEVPVNKEIPAQSTWKTAYADISGNLKSNALSNLKNVNGIEFVFDAPQAVEFLIDDILFAPKGTPVPVETEQIIETDPPATDAPTGTSSVPTDIPETDESSSSPAGWVLPVCIAAGVLVIGGIAALLIVNKKKK